MKYNYNYKNERGEYAPKVLTLEDGRQVINPTEEMYAEAGYLPWTPPQPTDEEIAEQQRFSEIDDLKRQLFKSDFKAIKYAEGWISEEDYADIKAERQALRDRINELEEQII